MRGPARAGGSSGSKGRTRSNNKPLICGEPCDCGGGLPCRIVTMHQSHACEECRGGSGLGRPRTEKGARRNHVTARISDETAAAIAQTGKSGATILFELGRAIAAGQPYDWGR